MSRMGGTCSTQKRRPWELEYSETRGYTEEEEEYKNCPRHSVVSAIPDSSIPLQFPKFENFVTGPDGRRTPKSLASLCIETLCRSIPNVDGDLPEGIPQDCVNDIVASLVAHSSFNQSTLRLLRTCELQSLDLSSSRGVSDEWIHMLHPPQKKEGYNRQFEQSHRASLAERENVYAVSGNARHDAMNSNDDASTCSTTSFMSACSSASAQQLTEDVSHTNKHEEENVEIFRVFLSSVSSMSSTRNSATESIRTLDLRGANDLTDWGLLQLSALPNVEEALLDNCHGILGRGMMVFTTSSMLHTLSFVNCRRLTDEALVIISHLKSLKYLYLDGCRCLTDKSLTAISNMTSLERLDLNRCDQISDAGLKALANLSMLEELLVGWCRQVTDEGVTAVASHAGRSNNLHTLGLSRCNITDDSIPFLIQLVELRSLDVNGCSDLSSEELGRLVKFLPNLLDLDASYCPEILRSSWQSDSLKNLNLCYSSVKDSHLRRLGSLPNLEHLNLDSCLVTDLGIIDLVENKVAPNLKSIELADTDVSDSSLIYLAKLSELKVLSLLFCNITNLGLRHIGKMSQLEVLNLDSRDISDYGLKHLEKLEHLKTLDLFSSRITDMGCFKLSKIKSLETLELCGGGIGDVGCSHLSRLQNLTVLNLAQNEGITNRGAAALSSLKKLTSLNLSHTRVSSDALVHLNRLKKLESLALYGCGEATDRARLERLQSRLPNLRCVRTEKVPENQGIVHDRSEHYSSSGSTGSEDMDVGYD